MPVAYTPGLRVAAQAVIRKERRLPIQGEVLVVEGQEVTADTIVARALLPGNPVTIRAAERLGVEPNELPGLLLRQMGDQVAEGEVLAETKGLWGLFRSQLRAPAAGAIEHVSDRSGFIALRGQPIPIEVDAYVEGRVVEVIPGEGAVVETTGAFIQGIFGVGGERRGELLILADEPDEALDPDRIIANCEGAIGVAGATASPEAIRKCAEANLAGLIVGAVDDAALRALVGHDIGVAITGQEDVPLTLILTEGFGSLPMARRTFELLRSLEGRLASINGATQVRAGVIRPEIIVPGAPAAPEGSEAAGQELAPGASVRIIREPHFGQLARVVALPPELREIETEAHVRVVELELADGQRVIVPRANVEIIQQ